MKCATGSYSQLSTQCQKCVQKDMCKDKRMEAVAYIIPNAQQTLSNTIEIAIGNQYTNSKDITEALKISLEQKLACGFMKQN